MSRAATFGHAVPLRERRLMELDAEDIDQDREDAELDRRVDAAIERDRDYRDACCGVCADRIADDCDRGMAMIQAAINNR